MITHQRVTLSVQRGRESNDHKKQDYAAAGCDQPVVGEGRRTASASRARFARSEAIQWALSGTEMADRSPVAKLFAEAAAQVVSSLAVTSTQQRLYCGL